MKKMSDVAKKQDNSASEQLADLVSQAGGVRKAADLIKSVRGVAPGKSSVDRGIKGSGREYSVQCMIDDLTSALHAIKLQDKVEVGVMSAFKKQLESFIHAREEDVLITLEYDIALYQGDASHVDGLEPDLNATAKCTYMLYSNGADKSTDCAFSFMSDIAGVSHRYDFTLSITDLFSNEANIAVLMQKSEVNTLQEMAGFARSTVSYDTTQNVHVHFNEQVLVNFNTCFLVVTVKPTMLETKEGLIPCEPAAYGHEIDLKHAKLYAESVVLGEIK